MNNQKIENTIQNYITGYLNADKNLIGKAFSSETVLYSVDEDQISKLPMNDWFKNLDDRAARNDKRVADAEIKLLDVTDDTAMVKLCLKFETMQFTDYLSLLKVKEEWVIVGKIYSVKS